MQRKRTLLQKLLPFRRWSLMSISTARAMGLGDKVACAGPASSCSHTNAGVGALDASSRGRAMRAALFGRHSEILGEAG